MKLNSLLFHLLINEQYKLFLCYTHQYHLSRHLLFTQLGHLNSFFVVVVVVVVLQPSATSFQLSRY